MPVVKAGLSADWWVTSGMVLMPWPRSSTLTWPALMMDARGMSGHLGRSGLVGNRPVETLADAAAHDPLELLRGEVHVLGEVLYRLPVCEAVLEEPCQVSPPEAAPGAHPGDESLDVLGDVPVGIRMRGVCGYRRHLHVDVGMNVKVRRLLHPVADRIVHAAGHDAHVVDDDPESGVALGDGPELRLPDGSVDHRLDTELLGERPVPRCGAVDHPVAILRAMEGEPRPLDVRNALPVAHHRFGLFGLVLRHASHDSEAVGVLLAGFQRVIDAVTFPRRRHDQHAADTGLVHQLQALLVGESLLAMAVEFHARARARQPGAVRSFFLPDVDLRIDNEHCCCVSATTRNGRQHLTTVAAAASATAAQPFGAGT